MAIVVWESVDDSVYGATNEDLGDLETNIGSSVVDGTYAAIVFHVGGEAEAEEDLTAPVIGNVLPAPGASIDADEEISFEVTDDSGNFARIVAGVHFPDGDGETLIAHNGNGFIGSFVGYSSRVAIAGGFRYTLQRLGGWPSRPAPVVFVVDASGNDAGI